VLLAICTVELLANAAGWPFAPNSGAFSLCLTGVLFAGGIGYLHALGNLHSETRRAADAAKAAVDGPTGAPSRFP
jgi:uncharacterized membrane protein